jgi:energy-converting hydrogenase B subunit D
MTGVLTLLLYLWMIAGAILAIRQTDLLQAVVGLSLVSLGAVGQFFLLHAPDVALTEAAIGVAAGSFVLLMGVRQFGRDEERDLS